MLHNKAPSVILLLVTCLWLPLNTAELATQRSSPQNPSSSSSFAEKCTHTIHDNITNIDRRRTVYLTSCRIHHITELLRIEFPTNVFSLILSHNSLRSVHKEVFNNLTFLRQLYLDHNLITEIDEGVFSRLYYLEHLDLSYNLLKAWSGSIAIQLPALQSLNLAHNRDLVINKAQMMNTNCSIMIGLNIDAGCKACNFTREQNFTTKMLIKKLTGMFKRCIYFPEEHNSQLQTTTKAFASFNGMCQNDQRCFLTLTDIKPLEKLRRDMCYSAVRRLRPVVFILGTVALVLNLVVVTSILGIKKLRQMVPFLLVAHLSFCDMITGIYALGTAAGHETSTNMQEIEVYRLDNSKCPVFWVVFLLGQTLGVFTCLLVTIERYLATVYCMKPLLKLEWKTALSILPCFWFIAIIIALPLQLVDYRKITLNFMCVLLRDYSPKKGFFVSQGLMVGFLSLYVIVIFLYCRIYISVRNSSRRVTANIHREARLAKRIGVIVMTNFVCFALPNLLMLVFTTTNLYTPLDDISNTLIRRWLPPMCLVLNACANPCFFAYGNLKFSTSLKHALRSLTIKYFDCGTLLAKGPKVSPADVEMNLKFDCKYVTKYVTKENVCIK